MVLAVFVDDIALASNSRKMIKDVKYNLDFSFQVKLLGKLRSLIGWKIIRSKTGILVHQKS